MNDRIEDLINGLSGHSSVLDSLMRVTANDLIYVLPLVLVALWLWPGRSQRSLNQRVAVASAAGVVVALLCTAAISHLHSDVRPFVSDSATRLLISHSADNGFPSDHTTLVFGLGGVLVWWRRWLGLGVLMIGVLVGFSRVYVGVHWPSDVVAGAAVGFVVGTVVACTVPLLATPQRWACRFLPPALLSPPQTRLS